MLASMFSVLVMEHYTPPPYDQAAGIGNICLHGVVYSAFPSNVYQIGHSPLAHHCFLVLQHRGLDPYAKPCIFDQVDASRNRTVVNVGRRPKRMCV